MEALIYFLLGALLSLMLACMIVYVYLSKYDFRFQYFDFRKLFSGRFKPKQVAVYYDEWHNEYAKYYGNVIQAWRPASEDELNLYTLNQAGLTDGMRILDAGCGYAGPATYFAQHLHATIDAVTISLIQNTTAKDRIGSLNLKGSLNLICDDYNNWVAAAAADTYDRVLFLESFGYAENAESLAPKLYRAIKPGGELFIKDFFKLELPENSFDRNTHALAIKNMDQVYLYNTLNLYHTIYIFRKHKFELIQIKKPEYMFDEYKVVNGFQDNNQIDLYEGRPKFFIVEPLELRFKKPLQ
jgi:SAM-dependent methyltransferase